VDAKSPFGGFLFLQENDKINNVMEKRLSRKLLFIVGVTFLFAPLFVQATTLRFNIDSSYDYMGRSEITAFLYQIGDNAYYFIEEEHYQNLDIEKRKSFTEALKSLSQEFDQVIYPQLTDIFGQEWKPGVDGDEKITVLLTRIKEDRGGYFNPGDEYPRAQVPTSNEREMIYMNVNNVEDELASSYLAHEFVHLITFNQKERIYGVKEETWLNEARAEVAPTLLGYDEDYQGSSLQKRVKILSQSPGDSLTEWKGESPDYGAVNLFTQYLLDHYGVRVLTESLQSGKAGIPSLDYALEKRGFDEDFSEVFTDWIATLLVNDCSVGPKYCYLNQNLKNIKIIPQLNYLPLAGESTLSVIDYTKDWAGNWVKFIGGKGMLKLEFIGNQKITFKVPYVTQSSSGVYEVGFLELDEFQRGTTYIANFGQKYNSLVMIPVSQEKTEGFNGIESFRKFIWTASVISENSEEDEELINQLLVQIASLQAQIAQIQARINAILAQGGGVTNCSRLGSDLYYGMKDNAEVRCLQQFLKDQGADIYPEGLVTGNFSNLTLQAVIRFQEKYVTEILTPIELEKGTGYVGSMTRSKINQLL